MLHPTRSNQVCMEVGTSLFVVAPATARRKSDCAQRTPHQEHGPVDFGFKMCPRKAIFLTSTKVFLPSGSRLKGRPTFLSRRQGGLSSTRATMTVDAPACAPLAHAVTVCRRRHHCAFAIGAWSHVARSQQMSRPYTRFPHKET